MSGARALRLLAALLAAALWGAALATAHVMGEAPVLDRMEAALTDFRTLIRGKTTPPDIVTIVAIDDDLVREEKSYPLPRATLARLINTIADLGPQAIGIDILLVEPGPGETDQLLARALAKRPTVIAAAAVFPKTGTAPAAADGPLARVPVADHFLLPLPIFAKAASIGVVNVATDGSGIPRSVPLVFRTRDRLEASFALRIAALATGTEPVMEPGRLTLGGRTIRTDIDQAIPIASYGPVGTIRTIGAGDVLKGRIGRESVENRIVVVGSTVTGGGDVFPTSFGSVMPGAEVMSTAISHLMAGDGPVRDHTVRLADAGVAVLLPVVLVGLLAWRRNMMSFTMIAGVLIAWAVVNIIAFQSGIWMSAALPLAAAVPPAILFGAGQLWFQRRRAQHFALQSKLLQRVQAPGLGHLLAEDPKFLEEPVRQNTAIVFVDLSGFTGLSETLGPVATREFLSAFYNIVGEEAAACGGSITAFTGDGAMILFGLPKPGPEDAAAAARCCIGLSHRLSAWLAAPPVKLTSRVGFKIGGHFGVVVISRLGRGRTQQIAATGDTVNIASRLMEIAVRFGADVAISDNLLNAAGRSAFEPGVLVGPIQTRLRGRTGSLPIWTWRDAPEMQDRAALSQ